MENNSIGTSLEVFLLVIMIKKCKNQNKNIVIVSDQSNSSNSIYCWYRGGG